MVLGGTPVRPTLRTFVWASFEVTKAIMPPAISRFKETPRCNRVGTEAGRGE